MKIIYILLFISFPFLCFSQNESGKEKPKDNAKSNIELFTEKTGELFKKEFYNIGEFSLVNIDVLVITDVNKGTVIKGVRFSYAGFNALIDKDEVQSLLKSLNYIKENVITNYPPNYTEVTFKSRDGFSSGVFSGKKGLSNKKVWQLFIQLNDYASESMLTTDIKDIDKFISVLQDANKKLEE